MHSCFCYAGTSCVTFLASGNDNPILHAANTNRSITPEVLYTGINNLELRARAFFIYGDKHTASGEQPDRRRLEFQTPPRF